MPKIVGISGKKQSGKTSLCNYLLYYTAVRNSPYPHKYYQNEGTGNLTAQIGHASKLFMGVENGKIKDNIKYFPLLQPCKVYSLADPLKQDICINILDLSHANVYGTDEEKNEVTRYEWDNIPNVIRLKMESSYHNDSFYKKLKYKMRKIFNRPSMITGKMTAREIMQFVGTDIFREMFADDIWTKATIKKIIKEDDGRVKDRIALISDVRFKSEVKEILDSGGYIIRLTRKTSKTDFHKSEIDLDDFDFASIDNSIVIDNSDMSIQDKNTIASKFIEKVVLKGSDS